MITTIESRTLVRSTYMYMLYLLFTFRPNNTYPDVELARVFVGVLHALVIELREEGEDLVATILGREELSN